MTNTSLRPVLSRDRRAPGMELGDPRCNPQVRDGLTTYRTAR